jgi:hypothetical protein
MLNALIERSIRLKGLVAVLLAVTDLHTALLLTLPIAAVISVAVLRSRSAA